MSVDHLDTAALERYLQAQLPGFRGPLSARKFAGGQSNPTFMLQAASGRYVLRRKPPGELLKSAHAVDREFRVMRALADSDVPVAQVYTLCEDDAVIGSMFYVMEYKDGRIFWNAALPELNNSERRTLYDSMNKVLAALHCVDIEAVGLSDYGKPGNYYARQIGRWSKQYRASETESIEEMEQLMRWVETHQPADDGRVSLVHGDYRLDNLIFAKDSPNILAVVDWELSTLGHPLADLAFQCMQWRLPTDSLMPGVGDLDRRQLGIPSEAEYVARYCERSGYGAIDHWPFYLAFSFFRLAAILQGVKKRAIDGNASSTRALQLGEMVRPLARMGLDVIEAG